MRHLFLTAAFLAVTGPALASSIEIVGPAPAKGASILVVNCTTCPPLKAVEDKKAYKVPQIAPGTQAAEIVEMDGEAKLRRTESWLGGSPVVFISKAEGWSTDGSVIAAAAIGPDDGIDVNATTAAVSGGAAGAPVKAMLVGPAGPKPLDVTTYDLRLN
ncbi:hypothetical protein C0075_18730 [Rhizobium sp. KAs_5_22]|uniref:plant virulence effector HPE1-like domain-containing protein n=1 Tax=Ciceribacter selenitireducens TaxID=448181 RepID=UPI00048D8EE1|nr:plant virulence effector HPE1-like domain-containing protein [Ciceribacter selenitireducens]PPJ47577.1 hypothetical protein C0075_18730 [Rhizobium sp. KAs_5_22]